ncbi:hypothetical protein A0H81_10266 [Grifola frondosa]|uniref:Extracellular serine-rich protein n=1 Tax=Grifola frondosa TaxID=5627 RepID=A0A1C7LZC2_GRIFR|nr:hypothetical protein A0H81_10266 [Grifola frondosa]
MILFAAVAAVTSKDIVITVGHNTTDNATTVFEPAEVHADIGDTVTFNFTLGNHTATQSTFGAPCVPIHDTNSTINGFDSMFRDTVNGTAITTLPVSIIDNSTLWFFDFNTCGDGGVGVINANDSSTATLAGFQVRPLRSSRSLGRADMAAQRNAIRLNGTASQTSSSASPSSTSPGSQSSSSNGSVSGSANPSTTSKSSSAGAERAVRIGGLAVVPLILIALAL